jgi:hypothetical protein
MMKQPLLQLPFDAESLKLVSERLPFERDPIDLSTWRSSAAPRDKFIDSCTHTFGDRLD